MLEELLSSQGLHVDETLRHRTGTVTKTKQCMKMRGEAISALWRGGDHIRPLSLYQQLFHISQSILRSNNHTTDIFSTLCAVQACLPCAMPSLGDLIANERSRAGREKWGLLEKHKDYSCAPKITTQEEETRRVGEKGTRKTS